VTETQRREEWTKEDRLAFAAYLTALSGEGQHMPNRTQLHKTAYLLETAGNVRHGFAFTLHLHGPYSYELDAALSELSAIGWLRVERGASGYGARYSLTDQAREHLPRYAERWRGYEPMMRAIGKEVLPRGVADLELLTTAWYVIQEAPEASLDACAQRLQALKPHFSEERIRQGLEEIQRIVQEVKSAAAITTS
jgi:uncharacterized protein YwgA